MFENIIFELLLNNDIESLSYESRVQIRIRFFESLSGAPLCHANLVGFVNNFFAQLIQHQSGIPISQSENENKLIHLLMKVYSIHSVSQINANPNYFETIVKAIQSNDEVLIDATIAQISPQFFAQLSVSNQSKLFEVIFKILSQLSNEKSLDRLVKTTNQTRLHNLLINLPISAAILSEYLKIPAADFQQTQKKRKLPQQQNSMVKTKKQKQDVKANNPDKLSQEDLTEEIEVEVENEFDSYVVNVNFILELILEFLSIAEQKKNYQTIVEFVNRIVESCFKWLTYLIQIQVSADEAH